MRTPRLTARLAPLTARQQEIVALWQAGRSFGEIAALLKISKPTAWQHYTYARAKAKLALAPLHAEGLLVQPKPNGRRP